MKRRQFIGAIFGWLGIAASSSHANKAAMAELSPIVPRADDMETVRVTFMNGDYLDVETMGSMTLSDGVCIRQK